jgi:hypothetical protein
MRIGVIGPDYPPTLFDAALREQDATSFVQFDMADRARGSGGGVQRHVGEHLWEPVADVQSEPDEVWTRSGAARRTHNAATATPQVGLPKRCVLPRPERAPRRGSAPPAR